MILSSLLKLVKLIADFVIDLKNNFEEWRNMFFLTAGVYLLCGLPSILFVNSKPDKWAIDKIADEPEAIN